MKINIICKLQISDTSIIVKVCNVCNMQFAYESPNREMDISTPLPLARYSLYSWYSGVYTCMKRNWMFGCVVIVYTYRYHILYRVQAGRVNYVSCEMSNCSPYRKIYNSARCGKHYVQPPLLVCLHLFVLLFSTRPPRLSFTGCVLPSLFLSISLPSSLYLFFRLFFFAHPLKLRAALVRVDLWIKTKPWL